MLREYITNRRSIPTLDHGVRHAAWIQPEQAIAVHAKHAGAWTSPINAQIVILSQYAILEHKSRCTKARRADLKEVLAKPLSLGTVDF